ncbi:hypothetical protein LWI29_010159 [Acer saccharum]|uniref:non-specific serine/threonine protein kinase n=1 Tax=Acer saccharum TaxID=4024 RepID=A0AA39VZ98_ACESA|nr:hypothetical protein LWI29_010159 [Acer saccharum]
MVHILSALLGSSIFVNFLLLLGTFILFYRWNSRTKQQKVTAMPDMNLQSFTYEELEHITKGFKEELGSGAFGTVYKGVLAFDNNEFVAVKKLDKAASEGEQEFRSEVNSIGRTNHKNLVKLLGFCNEGQHRLLVKNFEVDAEEDQMVLSDYAYDCFRDGNLDLLVEKDEEVMNDMKRVKKFVMIAIWCIQEDPSLRPTMKKVTQMMEGAVEVSTPPDPISFIS